MVSKKGQDSTVTVDELAKEILPSYTEELMAEVSLVCVTREGTGLWLEAKFRAAKKVDGAIVLTIFIPIVITVVIQILRS